MLLVLHTGLHTRTAQAHRVCTRALHTHAHAFSVVQALLAALPASTGRAIHRSVTWLAPLHLDVSAQLHAAADEQECSLCTAVGRRVAPAAAAVPPALGGTPGPSCRAGETDAERRDGWSAPPLCVTGKAVVEGVVVRAQRGAGLPGWPLVAQSA